jgi:hypothetical protein
MLHFHSVRSQLLIAPRKGLLSHDSFGIRPSPTLHDATSNTNTQTTTSLVHMNTDNMLQILFGVIGTVATMLGVWVAWRMNGGMVISDRSKPRL